MKNIVAFAAIALAVAVSLVAETYARQEMIVRDDTHSAEKHKLGRKQIGGYTVSVVLIGEVSAGQHVDFDIKLIDAKTEPKALRVWIGKQDAVGAQKASGVKGQTTYTGEVTAPTPLPDDWQVWVELETDAGTQSAGYKVDHSDHKH